MKRHTSKVYGVWFYFLPPGQTVIDDSNDAFPPGNSRLVEYIPRKEGEWFNRPDNPDEILMNHCGANVIAIGRGDHFDIYDYRE